MSIRQRIQTLLAVGANVLYHATPVDNLYEILEANEIKPNTAFPVEHTGGEWHKKYWKIRPTDITNNGYLKGVSLTRNLIFARAWKSDGVVLELDADKLKQRLRLFPISFYRSRRTVADESEELVIGDIKPLSNYLLYIEASAKTVAENSLLNDIGTLFATPFKLKII
ncbi:MAG TPA: hypothetical protein VNX68_15990, partial [Nitrosopumilaceae archaeon]|nr:hypothetical protein [Nitrosopumilaceae archaeon]